MKLLTLLEDIRGLINIKYYDENADIKFETNDYEIDVVTIDDYKERREIIKELNTGIKKMRDRIIKNKLDESIEDINKTISELRKIKQKIIDMTPNNMSEDKINDLIDEIDILVSEENEGILNIN
jgi:hypothetical protein